VARHQPDESLDALFKRVDDALYRAKNDGRNKVLAA
jgi:PleD family two-component response regulator